MKADELAFSGIEYVPVHSLGFSQIYLRESKIRNVQTRFRAENLSGFAPLPVRDFGSGRLTLTDGYTRAYAAWQAGGDAMPIVEGSDYERLWKDRCDVGCKLIINSSDRERQKWALKHRDLFLFGVSQDK